MEHRMLKHTILPSAARRTAPAPASPGFPFEAPSNSTIQEDCAYSQRSRYLIWKQLIGQLTISRSTIYQIMEFIYGPSRHIISSSLSLYLIISFFKNIYNKWITSYLSFASLIQELGNAEVAWATLQGRSLSKHAKC